MEGKWTNKPLASPPSLPAASLPCSFLLPLVSHHRTRPSRSDCGPKITARPPWQPASERLSNRWSNVQDFYNPISFPPVGTEARWDSCFPLQFWREGGGSAKCRERCFLANRVETTLNKGKPQFSEASFRGGQHRFNQYQPNSDVLNVTLLFSCTCIYMKNNLFYFT